MGGGGGGACVGHWGIRATYKRFPSWGVKYFEISLQSKEKIMIYIFDFKYFVWGDLSLLTVVINL